MTRSERRRSSRCVVDFFVQEVRDGRTWLHPALDLSAGGIYIIVNDDRRALDGSQTMTLSFTLPTGIPVETKGRVTHIDDRHDQRGVGVKFTELDELQRTAIARFVALSQAVHRRNHAMA